LHFIYPADVRDRASRIARPPREILDKCLICMTHNSMIFGLRQSLPPSRIFFQIVKKIA
jgi:hypothetical protein